MRKGVKIMDKKISKAVVERLPLYLQYLKSQKSVLGVTVSATTIARELGLGEVQVRKDLCAISGAGRPKVGYIVDELIAHLEGFLGYHSVTKAVIVGAGKLGNALYDYQGFKEYGLEIVSAFDCNPEKIGEQPSGQIVRSTAELSDFCKENDIKIGIITVPAKSAQAVCDLLVECGILAIWNFAPIRLEVPKQVLLQHENMAASLAVLSSHLMKRLG
jgi:redox-sensing transcriptional repressor